MNAYYEDGLIRIFHGDCRTVLAEMDADSIDACVTDPPYELTSKHGARSPQYGEGGKRNYGERIGGFMGMKWDRTGVAFDPATWAEVLRVLKPGAHLLAFGGTRTFHRMTVAIEDAGFEIRDCLSWLYGSGFPKSLDVSKAIDKAAGELGTQSQGFVTAGHDGRKSEMKQDLSFRSDYGFQYQATTSEAEQWDGWGSALKPAMEMIVLARKPLSEKTIAANVLKHGTGAINIDASRIGIEPSDPNWRGPCKVNVPTGENGIYGHYEPYRAENNLYPSGRWPSNVLLDEEAAALLDEQTGPRKGRAPSPMNRGIVSGTSIGGHGRYGTSDPQRVDTVGYGDVDGASRFFFTAKASREERSRGMYDFAEQPLNWSSGTQSPGTFQSDGTNRKAKNHHPCVKPISLMKYLIRLITPPGGVVLDPFLGSGSTMVACRDLGVAGLGIELEEAYCKIAIGRLSQRSLFGLAAS